MITPATIRSTALVTIFSVLWTGISSMSIFESIITGAASTKVLTKTKNSNNDTIPFIFISDYNFWFETDFTNALYDSDWEFRLWRYNWLDGPNLSKCTWKIFLLSLFENRNYFGNDWQEMYHVWSSIGKWKYSAGAMSFILFQIHLSTYRWSALGSVPLFTLLATRDA